jgi:hypothetical protein
MAETNLLGSEVTVITDRDSAPQKRPVPANSVHSYLDDFLLEVAGRGEKAGLRSSDCLRASRLALETQQRADGAAKPSSSQLLTP